MNGKLERLVSRLETTTIPKVEGQLRSVDPDGTVCMCPLGHLVDMYIEETPGAEWLKSSPDYFTDPNYERPDRALGFPTKKMLEGFGLSEHDAYLIYRQNDGTKKTPAQVADFIREELSR